MRERCAVRGSDDSYALGGSPGGAFDGVRGWNAAGTTKWTYVDTSPTPPGGIYQVTVWDRSQSRETPGLVKFRFRGRGGSYAAAGTVDVLARVVLPSGGECLVASFPGPSPAPVCTFRPPGRTLRCR
jgi:hypothetical protein